MVDFDNFPHPENDQPLAESAGEERAVLGGGCFWCTEAVFKRLDGVLGVAPGYAGGSAETADYRTVCSGTTDHAEVIEVRFDPSKVTYGQLLEVFFSVAHDPTEVDRQGPDSGRQYRSVVFYADDEQRRVAESYIDQLERAGVYDRPIATTLEPLDAFYEAEDYHRDYAERHPWQPYIAVNARPKVEKLERGFGDRLRRDES
ncbi:MAG: peptide-methionine (S)-S-oxide reductase MsrA [Thermoanaerobaculia bacterium]|nr:peptide-methionine (S)-S-oxide reductase MsrA [Thermoanaerobaculia bacterium]